MKLAVVGSRGIHDYDLVKLHITKYAPTHIISGGAKGVDTLAKQYALEHALGLTEIVPEYTSTNSKFAPLLRNKDIVNVADFVLIFWDGKSKGTQYVINFCKKIRKPYAVVAIGFEYPQQQVLFI